MTLKNPSQWVAPSGTGFIDQSGGFGITTLSGSQLTTLGGVSLISLPLVYSPKSVDAWTPTTKNDSKWIPNTGEGYVIEQGTLSFATNSGNLLVTNSGDQIVTTPDYTIPKYPTLWSETGA